MKKMYKFLKLVVIFILGMDAVATAQIFTFTCPTTTATWTVPAGVTKIHIDMAGGKGGTNSWPVTGGPAGGPYATTFVIDSAGHGARVEADLNVTPGQVFTINVGQKGLDGVTGINTPPVTVGGGWAYFAPTAGITPNIAGGGGGGASDIRVAPYTLFERIAVAGGGGGAGGNYVSGTSATINLDRGGDGGGTTGEPGSGNGFLLGPGAGGGGSSASGGSPGSALGLWPAAGAGTWGTGGFGTAGTAGGGGGGGYYGGGGGCWSGGGGGSSYVDGTMATSVLHTRGGNAAGCGWVIICCPNPGTILGPSTICTAVPETYTNPTASPVGTWSSSNTTIATIGATTGVATGISTGVVTFTYTISGGSCGYAFTTKTVTVNLSPAPISGATDVCMGYTTTLTNTTPGGAWASSAPAVATIVTTGLVTPMSPGSTVISYTTPLGCFTTTTVNVFGLAGPHLVCVGNTITLTASSPGGTWVSGDPVIGSVSSAGVVTGLAMGIAPISYTFTSGCTVVWMVTVNTVAPIAGRDSICVDGGGYMTNIVGGGAWTSTYPAVASITSDSGIVTGHLAGITTISYMLPSGCLETKMLTVVDNPPMITGTMKACPGSTSLLGNPVPGGTWSVSDTWIATIDPYTGVLTGVTSDTTTVTYTIPPGCLTASKIVVYPLPSPITGPDVLCPGAKDTMRSEPWGGNWTSGTLAVATIDTAGIASAVWTGVSSIVYSLPSGCYRSKLLSVNPIPKPWIAYNFAIQSFVAQPGYVTYQWYDSIQGKIPHATSPSLAALNNEFYFVEVTDSNGCIGRSDKIWFDVKQLGLNNVNAGRVSIYPNPARASLFIEALVPVRAVISTVDGRKEIEVANAKEVDISRLASGLYLIALYDDSGVRIAIQKFVKE